MQRSDSTSVPLHDHACYSRVAREQVLNFEMIDDALAGLNFFFTHAPSLTDLQVREEATKTTTSCFDVVGNPDLISSIPYLVGCINRPESVGIENICNRIRQGCSRKNS